MKTKASLVSFLVLCLMVFGCGGSSTETDNTEQNKDSISDNIQINQKDSVQQSETTEVKDIDAKTLCRANEKIVFSFKTDKGKIMSLSMDKNQKYLVYRFGSDGKVELQYPDELSATFEKFTYNYYMRGGGAGNAGLDLNYVSFTGDTHKIIIFEEYSAGDPDNPKESTSIGIRIVDLKTKKETKIKGLEKTKQGSLIDFRDNGLIKVEEGEI